MRFDAMRFRLAMLVCLLSTLSSPVDARDVDAHQQWPGVEARSTRLWVSVGDAPLPKRWTWNGYSVVLDKTKTEDRLRIIDAAGITRKEMHAVFFNSIKTVQFDAHGHTALWVEAAASSNIVQHKRTYFFQAETSLRNVLVVAGYVDHVRILPSGQVMLATNSFAVMEWVADICHACAPNVTLLIGRHHGRFVLENRRYPQPALSEALAYRTAMQSSPTNDFNIGDAIGYYANLATIGRGREALHYIRHHLPPERWEQFRQSRAEVDKRLRSMSQVFWVSSDSEYVVSD
jgi:hypothetical protein